MSFLEEEPLKFITDERFDFDLPHSPKAAEDPAAYLQEEDDDIFFGPMGHKEKCIAAVIEEEAQTRSVLPLSPLSAKEHAEIFKEAHTIAYMLRKTAAASEKPENGGSPAGSRTVTISRTASRLSPENSELCAVKRKLEDFNVDDDSCDSDTYKKSRKDVPVCVVSEPADISDDSNSASSDRISAECNRSGIDVPKSGQKRLRLPSPKRHVSSIKREESATQNDTEVTSLLQPPRKRFALASPEDDSKALTRRSMESTRRSFDSNRTSTETSTTQKSRTPASCGSAVKPRTQGESSSAQKPRTLAEGLSAQKPRALAKPTSSLPAPKSMLKQPGTGIAAPKMTGLRQPANLNASKLKAPAAVKTGMQAPSQLQKPMSKLQLMKPNAVSMQRKAVHSEGKTAGPLKATASLQSMSAAPSKGRPSIAVPKPVKATHTVNDRASVKKVATVPIAPSTPTRQSSDSSSTSSATPVMTRSAKRLSCLPTPRRSVGSSAFRSSASSMSSVDSFASPAIRKFSDGSPGSMLSKKPLVQHTPIGGNKENKKLSAWSPVRRPKPISLEEELTQCTKRNAPRFGYSNF